MDSLVGPNWLFWYPPWHRFGPRCQQNAPAVAHTAALASFQRLELSQDFRNGPLRCSAKGIVMPGSFGCGATRCDPEMGRNTLDQHIFFVCTPAPEAWHGRWCKPARRAWADSTYSKRTSRCRARWVESWLAGARDWAEPVPPQCSTFPPKIDRYT